YFSSPLHTERQSDARSNEARHCIRERAAATASAHSFSDKRHIQNSAGQSGLSRGRHFRSGNASGAFGTASTHAWTRKRFSIQARVPDRRSSNYLERSQL